MFSNPNRPRSPVPLLTFLGALVILVIFVIIRGLIGLGLVIDELKQVNEGLDFHLNYVNVVEITPEDGYSINYYCLAGESKFSISNVERIVGGDTLFKGNQIVSIDQHNCIREVIKK